MSGDWVWQIRHECPQCGAPVIIKETERILKCPFCRTRLYLVEQRIFRYCLSAAADIEEEIFFFPYYRIRGSLFSMEQGRIEARYIDASQRMIEMTGLPQTLGVRPQAMSLSFVLPSMKGTFIKAPASDSFMKERLLSSERLIGETESVIYQPVYAKRGEMYDAVLGRPIGRWPDCEVPAPEPHPPCGIAAYVATLCPRCGGDLAGEGEVVVFPCFNCETLWSCEDGQFSPLTFGLWELSHEATFFLPFWCLRASLDWSAMPRIPFHKPLYFWVPAFKLNPVGLLRWSRQMTVFQPNAGLTTKINGKLLHPITLPLKEAKEMIPITLADMMGDKKMFIENVFLEEVAIVYHPFVKKSGELVHGHMGLAISLNALRLGLGL